MEKASLVVAFGVCELSIIQCCNLIIARVESESVALNISSIGFIGVKNLPHGCCVSPHSMLSATSAWLLASY